MTLALPIKVPAPRPGASRKVAALAGAALALMLALAGCSPRRVMVGDLPPETSLFVQFPSDTVNHTVNHMVHLYWYGSDIDGEVVGFEARLLNPAAPTDTQWAFTERRDSLLTVYTPAGSTSPVFEVRSIDDRGQRDPTPARQKFDFSNHPAVVTIASRLHSTDTTFASVTVNWSVQDADGDASKIKYFVYFDSAGVRPASHATALQLTVTGLTLPSAYFKEAGVYTSRLRTLYVQALDDGGLLGAPDSMKWFVRAPVTGSHARLLVIDDYPSTQPANFTFDTLYSNAAIRNLPAGTFSILRLEFTQPFRSSADLEQTFKLFDAVLWYRGQRTDYSRLLQSYQDGVGAYLDAGGKFYVDGLYLVDGLRTPGSFDHNF
ncbi:MAG: hypothetical protein HYR73_06640, partial [Candidatus Eisenbacteria bacterium]|nr:hypothetical protein [Candidatus Eisenbacteria bacterium]